jgi:uncharacterized membrane protein
MMSEVGTPEDPAGLRLVSRWAAVASALVAIVPTTLVVVNELGSEFAEGGTVESHEVVTLAFTTVVVVAIAFALIASALRSTARPELFLAAAIGGLTAFGLLTFWLAGAYAVATALAIVAWITGRTTGGPLLEAELVVFIASAAAVFVLYAGENALSAAVMR